MSHDGRIRHAARLLDTVRILKLEIKCRGGQSNSIGNIKDPKRILLHGHILRGFPFGIVTSCPQAGAAGQWRGRSDGRRMRLEVQVGEGDLANFHFSRRLD